MPVSQGITTAFIRQLLLSRQFLCASILRIPKFTPSNGQKYQPDSRKWSGYCGQVVPWFTSIEGFLAETLTSSRSVLHVDVQKNPCCWCDFCPLITISLTPTQTLSPSHQDFQGTIWSVPYYTPPNGHGSPASSTATKSVTVTLMHTFPEAYP